MIISPRKNASCSRSCFVSFLLLAKCCRAELYLGGGPDGWNGQGWYVQVDGVMGGRSSGQVDFTNDSMIFSGNIVVDGGGFASVRKRFGGAKDFSGYSGIHVVFESEVHSSKKEAPVGLHLQLGDDSWYSFAAAMAVPYSQGPRRQVCEVFIPMAAFSRASNMGSVCPSCKLNTRSVNELDVYVLFQQGAFEVRLRSIRAVTTKPFFPTVPTTILTSADVSELLGAAIESGGYLYDKGYRELCTAVYLTTARQILAATGPSSPLRSIACVGLRRAAAAESQADKAWILRKVFDAIGNDIKGVERRGDGSYPSSIQGGWLPAPGETLSACDSLAKSFVESSGTPAAEPGALANGTKNVLESRFLGPFTGMGISGYNDLGFSSVSTPEECARKCAQDSRCKSFDYGARGNVAGECWLSTANRESAGSAYTQWNLYDYYERSAVIDAGLDANSGVKDEANGVAVGDADALKSDGGKAFVGPFVGMGISGYNDLGSFAVSDPEECAQKCLQDVQCKSFDYGARASVAGECWLSTANRESAGSAYTQWKLYDYYERSTVAGTSVNMKVEDENSGPTGGAAEALGSDLEKAFLGPFVGMGISGYNDLGSFAVSEPTTCAQKCLQVPMCKSFDHGSRGKVAGECWLSTANRESAGSAYTQWKLYDYYERVSESESSGDERNRGDENVPIYMVIAIVLLAVIALGSTAACLYMRLRLRKLSKNDGQLGNVNVDVSEGTPSGVLSDPTVVVIGQPVTPSISRSSK
eukprot:TRINITY_DN1279_c0_g2_i3.p1 TRINITY_DN1279_c0_g2~~TRINITY_DN1279_c0_g2_i3.p1  ORF type:complete len:756 (+),score=115.66 TRINITY_DN1279_c0_g2_i3:69-2336(+)